MSAFSRRLATLPALLALAALAAVPAAAQSAAPPVETFDSAWTAVQRTHFDTAYNGVDWNAVRAELRPRAAAAKNPEQLRGVLREMLGRLNQSHFYLIPAEVHETLDADPSPADASAETAAGTSGEASAGGVVEGAGPGDAGMDVRLVDGRVVVTRVAGGGAAEAAGVRTGWTVEAVGGVEVSKVLAAVRALDAAAGPREREMRAWGTVLGTLAGPEGAPVRLRLRDGSGRPTEVRVVRGPARGAVGSFGNLPERPVLLERERVRMPDGTTVGVIRFDLWMPVIARAFDEAVDELRDADGIVVDIRGNPGGVGAMAMGFAGHFIDERLALGTMRTRDSELRFAVNPRRVDTRGRAVKPYAGPVAILTDALSASTSEIFAGGMQGLGRARVFGDTTAGQALPAFMRRLPNGDVLVHAFASLAGPGGEALEGRGVVPDQAVPLTRAELLAGRDPALEAAKQWISQQRRSGPAVR
jgi:carboxyl-terminal processing protease